MTGQASFLQGMTTIGRLGQGLRQIRRIIFMLMTANRTICHGTNVRRNTVQRVGVAAIEAATTRGGNVRSGSAVMVTPESGSSLA